MIMLFLPERAAEIDLVVGDFLHPFETGAAAIFRGANTQLAAQCPIANCLHLTLVVENILRWCQ
jgi:hypothetical protein